MNNLSNLPLVLCNFEVSVVRKLTASRQFQVKLLSVVNTDVNARLKFIGLRLLNFKMRHYRNM